MKNNGSYRIALKMLGKILEIIFVDLIILLFEIESSLKSDYPSKSDTSESYSVDHFEK